MTTVSLPETEAERTDEPGALTDGIHLVVDALKLNDVHTIYGVVGIPITDLARLAQASGIRYIGFRHESHAGHAAAAAGFLTKKPGICLTVSAPGFLNGLVALANATTNCFPMVQISGSSERHLVDLQRGDYEEMDQLAAAKMFAKAAYRVSRAEDIGRGIARAIRTAVSGRPGGVYLDIPAAVLGEVLDAQEAAKTLWRVVNPAPRQLPLIVLTGLFDAGGNAFLIVAAQAGRLDVAAVLSSLYPAGTVMLAWTILDERVTRWQFAGLVAALGAIVVITVP